LEEVSDMGSAHSLKIGGVRSMYAPRNAYFKRKWSREGNEWQNMGTSTPFGDPNLPLSYWPKPEDPLSIQNNEFKQHPEWY
jgi:hypothetical protein